LASVKKGSPCGELFKKQYVFSLAREYLFSLLSLFVINVETFQTDSEIQSISMIHEHKLHVPNTNLRSYQKGVYGCGSKVHNALQPNTKILNHDIKEFKPALNYFVAHFYPAE
jgi:hypothetical protein